MGPARVNVADRRRGIGLAKIGDEGRPGVLGHELGRGHRQRKAFLAAVAGKHRDDDREALHCFRGVRAHFPLKHPQALASALAQFMSIVHISPGLRGMALAFATHCSA